MSLAHPSAPISGPDAPTPLELFLDQHSKKLILALFGVLAVVAVLAALHLKRKKYEATAGAALVMAQDIEALRKVNTEFSDTPAGLTAFLFLADKQLESGDATGAAETLRTFLAKAEKHPLMPQARLSLANALVRLGKPEEAGAELATLIAAAPDSPLAPMAQMMQATLAEEKKDTAAAKGIYEQIKASYPESIYGRIATQKLDMVGFELPTEVEPPAKPATPPASSETPLLDGNNPITIPNAGENTTVPPGISLPESPPVEAATENTAAPQP